MRRRSATHSACVSNLRTMTAGSPRDGSPTGSGPGDFDVQQWFADHPWVVWIGLGAVLAIAEMLSLDLVLLMFALGALAAAVVAGFGVSLWLSVLVFAFVSGLLLLTVRKPLTHKLHDGPTLPTGYSELIGMRAEVVQRVDPRQGREIGRAHV